MPLRPPVPLLPRMLAAIDRINAAHPWSHNAAHHRWILRQARAVRRAGGTSALDIGCGRGELLRRLAAELPEVTGLEPDPASAATAAAAADGLPGARVFREGFAARPSGESWDLVALVAVLHHLPLEPTLRELARIVRPGGRLIVVGLAAETPTDTGRSLLSMVLNPLVGVVRHPRRVDAPAEPMPPTAEADETFAEIETLARAILPGVALRRCLFWRYRMRWVAPR